MKGIRGDLRKSLFPFLSSFGPLFLLLLIKNFNYQDFFRLFDALQSQYHKSSALMSVVVTAFDHWLKDAAGSVYWIVNIVLLLSSIWANYWLKNQLSAAEKEDGNPTVLSSTMQIKNYDILTYLMTYLLSLITWDPKFLSNTVVNIMILVLLYFFYSKQNMWTFNIFLIFWGYNLYEGGENVIITKIPLKTLLKRQRNQSSLQQIDLFGNVVLIMETKKEVR